MVDLRMFIPWPIGDGITIWLLCFLERWFRPWVCFPSVALEVRFASRYYDCDTEFFLVLIPFTMFSLSFADDKY